MTNTPKAQKEASLFLAGAKTISLGLLGIIVITFFAAVGNKVLQSQAKPQLFDQDINSEEVANAPEILNGQTVTVRAKVLEIIDANKFIIHNGDLWNEKEILIINQTGKPVQIANSNIEIQVTGEVGEFNVVEEEKEMGIGDSEHYVKYADKPTIFARSIALAPKPEDIANDPEQYYNQRVAVEAEIEEIVDENSFTLDASGFSDRDLLVVNIDSLGSKPREGQTVVVTGTIRPLQVTQVETDYQITWDLEMINKPEAEYKNKPVLFADKMYPSIDD
ncbi:MAG: hypothetical protein SAJ37_06025 [Oscillatoria sp. PMC 1068.18]|nr:hypothetical protein [Oscillatoria sp. PMC 1076.18]MEC4988289.1 hypothetical protein [Oscillatoria sp. PMC 1068.18]